MGAGASAVPPAGARAWRPAAAGSVASGLGFGPVGEDRGDAAADLLIATCAADLQRRL
jgi:hypothetical protein